MIADIPQNILDNFLAMGTFSFFSYLTVTIGVFALLFAIPVIHTTINQPQKKRSQIKLLQEQLEATQNNYLELQQKLQQLLLEKETLRQEGLRLHSELREQRTELTEEFCNSTFEKLKTLLTNYPSIHKMVGYKPELHLLSMFTPLDNLLSEWGYEPIGLPWEKVAYNPQIHQPDVGDIAEGELVYIRFVGYQHQDKILCPAKVSRTLPGGK
ncbi:MAG: hypothetical protein KME64_16245 [Scytonematopsis contorta HA4267-MV1]|jgi:molecular chaperone GrpE (heat shock protein)|nr:hypothetical protein [Scytonematopsis contorta HA4267-MV1]